MAKETTRTIAKAEIPLLEKTEAQLKGFYEDIGTFAKKKPDDPVNKFKLGFINQALEIATKLLKDGYRPFPDFDKFDIESLPTNSDVVTILSQYLRAMDQYRKDHTSQYSAFHYWELSENKNKRREDSENIRAQSPKHFH